MSKKEEKTEALKKHLGNVIECKECGSKKHSTKEHDKDATKEEHKNNPEERAQKETEEDEEKE